MSICVLFLSHDRLELYQRLVHLVHKRLIDRRHFRHRSCLGFEVHDGLSPNSDGRNSDLRAIVDDTLSINDQVQQ